MDLNDILQWFIVLVLGILELRRAWIILVKKEIGYYTGFRLSMAFIRAFAFDKQARHFEKINRDPKKQKASGYIGLFVGIFVLLPRLFWIPEVIDGLKKILY